MRCKKKQKSKNLLKGLRAISTSFLVLLLILSQVQVFGAYEAHVINVTAQIVQPCNPNIDLVQNGGFEAPIVGASEKWDVFVTPEVPGWQVEWMPIVPPSYGVYPRPELANLELHRGVSGWLPQEGSQYAELDTDWDGPPSQGGGYLNNEPASVKIYQDLPTIPGKIYKVKFYFSPRPNTTRANNILEFSWGGQVIDVISAPGGNNTIWTEYSYSFTATTTPTRLAFADIGTPESLGTFLDNVRVNMDCDTCPVISQPSQIVINEFLPDPVGYDDALMPAGEWVELYNRGITDVNVSNWRLYDNEDGHTLLITNLNTNTGNTIVPAGGFLVVYRNGDGDFALNNNLVGDTVRLYNGTIGSGADLIDAYTYLGPVTEGKTFARVPDGSDNWFDPCPTPGEPNMFCEIEAIDPSLDPLEPEEIEEMLAQEQMLEVPQEEPVEEPIVEQPIAEEQSVSEEQPVGEEAEPVVPEQPAEQLTTDDQQSVIEGPAVEDQTETVESAPTQEEQVTEEEPAVEETPAVEEPVTEEQQDVTPEEETQPLENQEPAVEETQEQTITEELPVDEPATEEPLGEPTNPPADEPVSDEGQTEQSQDQPTNQTQDQSTDNSQSSDTPDTSNTSDTSPDDQAAVKPDSPQDNPDIQPAPAEPQPSE